MTIKPGEMGKCPSLDRILVREILKSGNPLGQADRSGLMTEGERCSMSSPLAAYSLTPTCCKLAFQPATFTRRKSGVNPNS
jgi:hypothetical protein